MSMIKVEPIATTQTWRGKIYKKGSTQIPEELAIAMGLKTPNKSDSVTDSETKSATVADSPAPAPAPAPASESKTTSKRK